MADADGGRGDASSPESQGSAVERSEELERKMQELAAFRDAGVLTEAELEEQKVKLRWSLD